MFGTLEVNKISGNFHLALGQSFEKHHVHGKFIIFIYDRAKKRSLTIVHFTPISSFRAVHDINLSELLTVSVHLCVHRAFMRNC